MQGKEEETLQLSEPIDLPSKFNLLTKAVKIEIIRGTVFESKRREVIEQIAWLLGEYATGRPTPYPAYPDFYRWYTGWCWDHPGETP